MQVQHTFWRHDKKYGQHLYDKIAAYSDGNHYWRAPAEKVFSLPPGLANGDPERMTMPQLHGCMEYKSDEVSSEYFISHRPWWHEKIHRNTSIFFIPAHTINSSLNCAFLGLDFLEEKSPSFRFHQQETIETFFFESTLKFSSYQAFGTACFCSASLCNEGCTGCDALGSKANGVNAHGMATIMTAIVASLGRWTGNWMWKTNDLYEN